MLTSSYIFFLSVVGERLATRLRNDYYRNILLQDVSFFDSHRGSEIVERLSADIQEFKSSFKQVVALGLRNATQIVGSIICMFQVSVPMASALMLFVPTAIFVGTYLGGHLRDASRQGICSPRRRISKTLRVKPCRLPIILNMIPPHYPQYDTSPLSSI